MTALLSTPLRPLQWRAREFAWTIGAQQPLFMGILNVTPDSFSDGGRYTTQETALLQARDLIQQGADILDIGGESTRPGAVPVTAEDELRRVLPVIESIRAEFAIPLSIDTTKAQVARAALQAGASIVNDISGLTFDPEMARVCADSQAGIVAMHIQGTPQTMQLNPSYVDVVAEVHDFLQQRMNHLQQSGIDPETILLDPGIGFGKTALHNVELLRAIRRLRDIGRPLLIGHSRKRFLAKILAQPLDERTSGTIGVSVAAAFLGADVLRVHEVAASRQAWEAFAALAVPERWVDTSANQLEL